MNDTILETDFTNKDLILCDFDGTLAMLNSMMVFLHGLLSPSEKLIVAVRFLVLLTGQIRSGKTSRGDIKQALLMAALKGKPYERLNQLAETCARGAFPATYNSQVEPIIRKAQNAGATVVIVSASLDTWLAPICRINGWNLVCTLAKYDEKGFFSGFASPNCNHAEKARRANTEYPVERYERVFAFGNTSGDRAMLGLAHHAWMCDAEGKLHIQVR